MDGRWEQQYVGNVPLAGGHGACGATDPTPLTPALPETPSAEIVTPCGQPQVSGG